MLAMNPTPQESFSRLGSYSPKASGRQVCSSRACSSRAGSSEEDSDGLAFVAAVSAWPRICSRSNSDPLMVHPLKDSRALEPDDFSSNGHRAFSSCLSMIFAQTPWRLSRGKTGLHLSGSCSHCHPSAHFWRSAAPTGPPLVLCEPHFHNLRVEGLVPDERPVPVPLSSAVQSSAVQSSAVPLTSATGQAAYPVRRMSHPNPTSDPYLPV